MKSLVRWGKTIGLVGSTMLVMAFSGNATVLALTDQQIKEKLDAVPVFLITNAQGSPLSGSVQGQNGQKVGPVTNVYMNPQEAQAFINQLRDRKEPKLAEIVKTLQVRVMSLGDIYQLIQKTKNQPDRLIFALKPVEQDVKGAMELLRASGQPVQQLNSPPVFAVRFAPDKGYVSMKASQNKEVIPLFLSEQDAKVLLNQVKTKFPKADIQVIDVEGVVTVLKKKNDPWLKQVILYPDQAAIDYVQKLPRNNTSSPAQKK